LDTGTRAALIPRPVKSEVPGWPAFCDTAVIAREPGQPTDSTVICRLDASDDPQKGEKRRIWLRRCGTTGTSKWCFTT